MSIKLALFFFFTRNRDKFLLIKERVKDEGSSQNTKPDQSKSILLHYDKI